MSIIVRVTMNRLSDYSWDSHNIWVIVVLTFDDSFFFQGGIFINQKFTWVFWEGGVELTTDFYCFVYLFARFGSNFRAPSPSNELIESLYLEYLYQYKKNYYTFFIYYTVKVIRCTVHRKNVIFVYDLLRVCE